MPAVDYKNKPWAKQNPNRVKLTRPVWAHYGQVDLEQGHKFALDFGFQEAGRTKDADRIYYRGYNDQPVAYIIEKTAKPMYFGSAMEAATEEDLVRASKLSGAGPVRDCKFPGGGKIVTIKDPDGLLFHVVYGYTTVKADAPPKSASAFNHPQRFDNTKPRKGTFQRLTRGPAPIFKLGHFGHMTSDIGKLSAWYMENFNIRAIDIQVHPADKTQDFAVFYHLDLGKCYTDHHSFYHFQMLPFQKYPTPHHASFEVHDFEVQQLAHEYLEKTGYNLFWGIGRHRLGSQIFDYWYDTEGFILEHYTDGDVVNEDNPTTRQDLSLEQATMWGALEFHDTKSGYPGDPRPTSEEVAP